MKNLRPKVLVFYFNSQSRFSFGVIDHFYSNRFGPKLPHRLIGIGLYRIRNIANISVNCQQILLLEWQDDKLFPLRSAREAKMAF